MNITIEYRGLTELIARFDGLPASMEAAVADATKRATDIVYEQARDNISRMFRNPGPMQNALQETVTAAAGVSIGTVSISGIGYVTQEMGGTSVYDIFPVNAQALRFFPGGAGGFSGGPKTVGGGGAVFAKHVVHPPLPVRSYLRAALAQRRAEIAQIFGDAVRRGVKVAA